MRGLTHFEHRTQKVIPRLAFAQRLGRVMALWLLLTAAGLAIGMAGYHWIVGMDWDVAFLNAAMILSGMGPADSVGTHLSARLFAGFYAIFSGLVIVIATGFVLAPIFHRVLHRFHVESGKDE